MIALAVSSALTLELHEFEVPARRLSEGSLGPEVFDRRWILPERIGAGRDLLAEMRSLVALRLELDTEGTTRTATLGDLVVESRALDAAALFRADLVSIKAVENDYRTYRLHVGTDYEAIHPVPDSYVEAVDANGRPISALALWFRCDLPFPFTDYSCHLRILNRFAEDGTARTDIYSTSGDFHFLAGRDAFLPVETSAGELVACLVVRHFGFDLDGVPDGPAQRIEALRGSLGNLERKAERHHERSDRGFELSDLALTRFRVLGAR